MVAILKISQNNFNSVFGIEPVLKLTSIQTKTWFVRRYRKKYRKKSPAEWFCCSCFCSFDSSIYHLRCSKCRSPLSESITPFSIRFHQNFLLVALLNEKFIKMHVISIKKKINSSAEYQTYNLARFAPHLDALKRHLKKMTLRSSFRLSCSWCLHEKPNYILSFFYLYNHLIHMNTTIPEGTHFPEFHRRNFVWIDWDWALHMYIWNDHFGCCFCPKRSLSLNV